MRVRKMSILAGAAMGAVPLVGSAATISYSYEPFTYTLNGGSPVSVTPTLVAGVEEVNIPVGAVLQTGIQGSVVGSTVPSSVQTGAWESASAHNGLVPANLGFALFNYGFTDANNAVSVWDGSNISSSYNDYGNPIINANFTAGDSRGSDNSPADGGIKGSTITGGNSSPSTPTVPANYTSAQAAELSYGGSTSTSTQVDLVSQLDFDGLQAGTDIYTPINNATVPGQTGNQYFQYVSGGTSGTKGSNAPAYQAVNISSSDTVNALPSLEVIVGSSVVTNTNTIISLTNGSSGSVSGYGSTASGQNLGLTSTGTSGSYKSVVSTSFAAETTGFVTASGFSPTTDTEIYALKLSLPNGVTDAQVIADINASSSNVSASAITPAYASLFPGYDLLLTSTGGFVAGPGGTTDLGFDFSQDLTHPGIEVVGVAAVPEPATAVGIVLGAAGLLLGRRRSRVSLA